MIEGSEELKMVLAESWGQAPDSFYNYINDMEIKNFTITKRDGSKDHLALDKIMNAICKAFKGIMGTGT